MLNDPPAAADSERLLVLLAYGLLLLAPVTGGLLALVGLVIAVVRLDPAKGTLQESHYRNQIRVFCVVLAYMVIVTLLLAALALVAVALGLSLFSTGFVFTWPFWVGHLAGWAMLLPLVALASLAMVIWYYWRLLRGFFLALDDRAY